MSKCKSLFVSDVKLFGNDEDFKFIDRNYLWNFLLIQNSDKKIKGDYYRKHVKDYEPNVGEFSNDGKCRFCKKPEKDCKFTKDEHMFSEFLGNKVFISKKSECDVCNSLFSIYENNLHEMLKPYIVLDGIKGKNGTCDYKSNDKTSRVIYENGQLAIIDSCIQKVTFNDENKTLYYKFDVPAYSPLKAYKALCKMCLSILPSNELKDYSKMLDSLQIQNFYFGFEEILFTYFPGFNIFDFTIIGLKKKKKAKDEKCASFLFILMNSNFMLQIPLYNDEEIDIYGKQIINLRKIPTPFDKECIGEPITKHIFANTDSVVSKHSENIEFKYMTKVECDNYEPSQKVLSAVDKIKKDTKK